MNDHADRILMNSAAHLAKRDYLDVDVDALVLIRRLRGSIGGRWERLTPSISSSVKVWMGEAK